VVCPLYPHSKTTSFQIPKLRLFAKNDVVLTIKIIIYYFFKGKYFKKEKKREENWG
jgi:hypothetical protein